MLALQYIIVGLIIAGAIAFAGRSLYMRSRSFSTKADCGTDCGCGGKSKKVSS